MLLNHQNTEALGWLVRSWWDALSCLSLPPAQRSICTAMLPQRKVWRCISRLFCWHYSRDLLDWSSPLATPEASETPPGCIELKSASLSYWRSRSADGSGDNPEGYQELRYLPKLLQSKFSVFPYNHLINVLSEKTDHSISFLINTIKIRWFSKEKYFPWVKFDEMNK